MSLDLDSLRLSPEPWQLGPDDLIVAVMGVTGAGKSTFISHCTSGSQGPVISHGITSCEYARFVGRKDLTILFANRY